MLRPLFQHKRAPIQSLMNIIPKTLHKHPEVIIFKNLLNRIDSQQSMKEVSTSVIFISPYPKAQTESLIEHMGIYSDNFTTSFLKNGCLEVLVH